jgi:hypothetical protein
MNMSNPQIQTNNGFGVLQYHVYVAAGYFFFTIARMDLIKNNSMSNQMQVAYLWQAMSLFLISNLVKHYWFLYSWHRVCCCWTISSSPYGPNLRCCNVTFSTGAAVEFSAL